MRWKIQVEDNAMQQHNLCQKSTLFDRKQRRSRLNQDIKHSAWVNWGHVLTLTFQHLMCMPLLQVRPNSFSYHHEIWCIGNFLQRLNRLHAVNTYGFLFGFKIAVAVLWCFKIYKQTGWFYKNVEPLKKRNSFISNIWVQWDPCSTEKKTLCTKSIDHRTTLKLRKLLLYLCFSYGICTI